MADDKDNDDIESMQEGAAQEAKDRDDAKDSLKEHDAEKGENPDSEADIDAARKDADWDAAADHADKGGKFTK